MYPISSTVKALFDSEQHQVLRITGIDKNGIAINITDANVIIGGFGIDRYCCNGEKLEVGTAIAGQMTLKLNNTDGAFNNIVFEGTELFVEVGIADWSQSDPTVTYIPCGYFTPDVQPRRLNNIDLTCLDRMTKFDVAVDGTALTFPATVAGLVGQVDTLCGVTLAASIDSLPNAGVSIAGLPTSEGEMTYRNLIQWCAGIMATNAWFDWNGRLRFTWYNNSTGYETTMANRFDSDVYENDLTVTGAVYTNSSGVEIVEGTDDYAIDLTGNALAGPIITTVLPVVANVVSGFSYRPFTAAVVNAPYLWPMDVVTFEDRDGNDHTSVLTNVVFGINGNTALESRGMTYALNQRAQPKGVTKEQAQIISEAMERVETDIDESLTQQEIFNRLTDNGAAQGLILYNGQLYMNATYINTGELNADIIKGGTLTLGGTNDINGTLQVLDANGDVAATLNHLGMAMVNGGVYSYSADELTRTLFSNGVIAIQSYSRYIQPIGWRDALTMNLDTDGAHISSIYGGTLFIRGSGRVNLTNLEPGGVPDEAYATVDMDDDTISINVKSGSGIIDVADITLSKRNITFTLDNGGVSNVFELSKTASAHPLTVNNGGTGATGADAARQNLQTMETKNYTRVNIDTLKHNFIGTVWDITNQPSDLGNCGTLIVTSTEPFVDTSNRVRQVFHNYFSQGVWTRTWNGSAWSAWKCLVTDSGAVPAQDVTSQITLSSSEGSFSQYSAIKSAGSVYIAFVFTTNTAKSRGNSYTINLTFSDTDLRPITRAYNGGANSNAISHVGAVPNTSTSAYVYVMLADAVSSGSAFWVTVTYPCYELS